MDAAKYYGVAAFATGLVITLFLAAYLTPRAWWRRPNARALLIMVAGAWGIGSLILHAVPIAAAPAADTSAAAVTVSAAGPQERDPLTSTGQSFHVHRDLNLRAAPGVHAARVAVVPAGAEVTPTGARDGDWWQISTTVDGRQSTGWVSSLWLRRSGE